MSGAVIRVVAFDAYGTLFDVGAAARRAAGELAGAALAGRWEALARDWRLKQLQYSWLRTVAGAHADFWRVTQDALDWALAAAGVDDAGLRARLLALYRELDAYPEVPGVLAALRGRGLATAILSNGSPEMLEAAVGSAGIGDLLDAVLSAEAAGAFKPAAAVYGLVGRAFGARPEEVLFVSANGWDAAMGAGFGFDSVWVNRTGEPPERLPWAARRVVPDLARVPELAAS